MDYNQKKQLIILGIIIFISFIFQIFITSIHINNHTLLILSYLFLFILAITISICFYKLIKSYNSIEVEKLNYKTLSTSYDSLRAFKHDYSNIIQSIGGYIMLNDMDGLKTFYKDLTKEISEIDNISILWPETINNPSIYKTLTNKYYIANKKNIITHFNIFTDLKNTNIKTFDLNRIIGILLDNSIEAASECNEKIINVNILNASSKKIIKIENSFKNSNIDLQKIFEKSYSTKKNNTGLGLWEINRILKKYKNLNLNTYVNNNLFVQELEFIA